MNKLNYIFFGFMCLLILINDKAHASTLSKDIEQQYALHAKILSMEPEDNLEFACDNSNRLYSVDSGDYLFDCSLSRDKFEQAIPSLNKRYKTKFLSELFGTLSKSRPLGGDLTKYSPNTNNSKDTIIEGHHIIFNATDDGIDMQFNIVQSDNSKLSRWKANYKNIPSEGFWITAGSDESGKIIIILLSMDKNFNSRFYTLNE